MAQAALNYSRAELMAVCSAREIKNVNESSSELACPC